MDEGPADPRERSAELLRRWQEHEDRAALDELLRIEIGILKARIHKRRTGIVGPALSVSDVAQEAVLSLLELEAPPHFEAPQGLRAYLWTSAWRLLLARLRRPESERLASSVMQTGRLDSQLATTGGMRGIEDRDRSVALGLAVGLLEPDEQAVLELAYDPALGIGGAAQRLGVSHDAANTRLVRARRKLAKKLAHWTELIG